jgi:hypothetical protein
MKALTKITFVILLASLMQYGFANDSTARVGIGGLVLTQTDDISMEEEVLEISTKTIRVQYKFRNNNTKPIDTVVAFPMPAFTWNPGESAYDTHNTETRKFLTWVNGIKVKTKIETRAFLNDKEITAELKKSGISEDSIIEMLGCNVEEVSKKKCIPKAASSILKSIDSPPHSVQQTAWWRQVFPAQTSIAVTHQYEPKVGSRYSVIYADTNLNEDNIFGDWNDLTHKSERDVACIDDGAFQSVNRRIKISPEKERTVDQFYITRSDIEYILGTGRNWQGRTIKDFTLRIKKDKSSQIVSLCFPGKPKRIDDLTLEFKVKNLVAQDKLLIFFFDTFARQRQ